MSVKTLESYQEFIAVGSAYFTFNFNYADSSEIVVGMRTGDNTYEIVDPAHYVLTQNASTDGGKIRFVATKCENPDDPNCGDYVDNPPAPGTVVRIERKTVRSSTADWYVGLDMKALVSLFDKLFRITQENADKFNNTIKTFPTQQGIKVRELLESHDKKIFYWNNEKQWLDITDFTIDDVIKQTDVGNILEQANAYSDEQNAVLESRINGKLTAVDAQIDANADAIKKTRDDYIAADSEIHEIMNSHTSELATLRGNQASLGVQVSNIEHKIPESASGSNPLITKQQLLDEEMDIRDDVNEMVGELQTQITAQATAIAGKQEKLIAGDNIIISGNVITATGAGGGAGFDVIIVQELPAEGQKGIIYLLAKDSEAPDIYDEYIWVASTQTFEFIGTTQVDLSDYATKEDVVNKQDQLIAGDNITIVDNVISATGGGSSYTAGTGIDITNGTISVTAPTLQNKTNSSRELILLSDKTTVGTQSILIGAYSYNVKGSYTVAIGDHCGANGSYAVAIGSGARGEKDLTVSIGTSSNENYGTVTQGIASIAVGAYTKTDGDYSIALGHKAQSTAANAIQIGSVGTTATTNSDANTFKVGNANGNFELMSADGTIPADRMSATAGTTGQVLTKTDTGMEWQEASGGTTITLKEYDE